MLHARSVTATEGAWMMQLLVLPSAKVRPISSQLETVRSGGVHPDSTVRIKSACLAMLLARSALAQLLASALAVLLINI